jgi:hypothetical protein
MCAQTALLASNCRTHTVKSSSTSCRAATARAAASRQTLRCLHQARHRRRRRRRRLFRRPCSAKTRARAPPAATFTP